MKGTVRRVRLTRRGRISKGRLERVKMRRRKEQAVLVGSRKARRGTSRMMSRTVRRRKTTGKWIQGGRKEARKYRKGERR